MTDFRQAARPALPQNAQLLRRINVAEAVLSCAKFMDAHFPSVNTMRRKVDAKENLARLEARATETPESNAGYA